MTDSPLSDLPEASGDPLGAAWQRLSESWDDDDAHRAFIGLASTLRRLPDAARHYREARDANDARRPRAEKQLGAIAAVAFEELRATGSTSPKKPSGMTNAIGVLIALAFIVFALAQLRRLLN